MWNFEGRKFNVGNSYKILGTTIDFLVEKEIMKIPDYIKIDVDGIEYNPKKCDHPGIQ